jgi:eukaryotic-like serine/threonine-protein kinase
MSVSTTLDLVKLVRKSGLVPNSCLDEFLERPVVVAAMDQEAKKLAGLMVQEGVLTVFQAKQLLQGKWRGFPFGSYQVLEQLSRPGQSPVYLCIHGMMGRRVALKVLPIAEAQNPAAVARFHREARAAAALDHRNIVHAYDSGTQGNLHFLVTEYVDGSSLQDIITDHGPLDILRAAHYIRQAARGIQHLYQVGLVHRDIKPGNLLLDRLGVVRVLDLGLARFFHDNQDMLTVTHDNNRILGTADYLSPEQARDSHDVDIRTDIYSLGATFYFLLTGRPPFPGKTVVQKLLYNQTHEPTAIRELRPEVPEEMAAVLARMMAKDPAQRYATPAQVVAALAPWTRTPIPPPPAEEMPRLCAAALAAGSRDSDSRKVRIAAAAGSGAPQRGGPASAVATLGREDRPISDAGTADTDPALRRSDTDAVRRRDDTKAPLPTTIASVPPTPGRAPAPRVLRSRLVLWALTGGLLGAAALAWFFMR